MPSLLAMMGARPVFMDAVGLDPALNDCASYDHSPAYNPALVQRAHVRRLQQGDAYRQAPIPDRFLGPEARAGTQIAFLI
ncbi:hypothetical protein [Methylobacterium trifolii]|uniref:Uncharacterized protein n=1 Tax=Methylobacterium trifolii TaxID=1003092 RepID=A0ABQ4TYR3_9HYPH|nr:hypothetical protein [Methylobacterium trifolii]GJE59138.1 hypothetical protein MPOCJGCO_1226 [Methylobacterium trifolii]